MVHTFAVVHGVRKHPCLWDKTDIEYKNAEVRKESWMEICRSIYKDFDTNKQLVTERMTIVQRKWRSSRDYYVKRQKSKYASKTYSASKHLRALSFLSQTVNKTETNEDNGEEIDGEDDETQYFENEYENYEDIDEPNEGNDRNDKLEFKIEDPVLINASSYSDYGIAKRVDAFEHFDANKSFAMSLIKEMNSMTEQQNFQFRMEVMKALNTVKYKLPEYSKINED